MLKVKGLVELVERMLTTSMTVSGSEQSIRGFLAVVGNADRTGLVQRLKESPGRRGALVGLDLDEDPTGGAINGDEEVTTRGFIRHLRLVFDVLMPVTRFVSLERRMDGCARSRAAF